MKIEKARLSVLGSKADFPNLKPENLCVRSEKTGPTGYNCIAWAACDPQKWWWPKKPGFWPTNKREKTLQAFIEAFSTMGFSECPDGVLEPGIEKVVIYARIENARTEPTHAARQLRDGTWTSKLGPNEDILHKVPEDLCGPLYGNPIVYMKRTKQAYPSSNPGPSGKFVKRIEGDTFGKTGI
jgi:hypothetical protein